MTNADRREQIEREVEVACTDSMMTQDGLIHTTLDREQCERIVGLIIRREAALRDKLEIAENGIVSLRDTLAENKKLQKVAEAARDLEKIAVRQVGATLGGESIGRPYASVPVEYLERLGVALKEPTLRPR